MTNKQEKILKNKIHRELVIKEKLKNKLAAMSKNR